MSWSRIRATLIPLFLCMAHPGIAQTFEPVTLAPLELNEASLTVVGPDGSTTYTPAELEQLPTYRLVTTTPWREEAATFEGVLLSDVLKASGLTERHDLVVTAENDFRIMIPGRIVGATQILIATRVDGKPHRRRERGPLQFVFPYEDVKKLEDMTEGYWVWMAARIEPAN